MKKQFTVLVYNSRTGSESKMVGTLEELISDFSYTLECGKSYEWEKGNKKINRNPTTARGLVTNLNNAVNNSAANGYSPVSYSLA